MKRSTLDSYHRLCELRRARAEQQVAAASSEVEQTAERLLAHLTRLERFEERARHLAGSGVSAAQWALIENGRRHLLLAIDSERRVLERHKSGLSDARETRSEARRESTRCERIGERFDHAARKRSFQRAQRAFDDIGATAAFRKD